MRGESAPRAGVGAWRALAVGLVLIAACGREPAETVTWPTLAPIDLPPLPDLDFDQVRQGAELYAAFCAECHRADLSGDPQWKTRAEDGGFRPPPHDASGHTWHHPDEELVEIVLHGYGFPVPESRMPQFFGTLTEDEVRSILGFIKASWGTEERMYQWEQTVRRERAVASSG
ncbi:MAG TPA: cytochrome c [Acidimicrobiia bacterium]|nr:cytochrome c [Acidimicrobiia bacterium]